MLLIRCPYCELERPELEFVYAGEAHVVRAPNPSEVSDEDWASYLFIRSNTCGHYRERWRHTHGCGRFFNALRDTANDRFIATYRIGEKPQVQGS